MAEGEDSHDWSDDDIEVLLRFSADAADARDVTEVARFIADLKVTFSLRQPEKSRQLVAWFGSGDRLAGPGSLRHREMLAVNDAIDRVCGRA